MPSPFPPTSSKPGHGEVHLTLLPPTTPSFSTLTYTYPLKLLPSTPHVLEPVPAPGAPANTDTTRVARPANVPLLFLLTYGGGLLAGDAIVLSVVLDAGTRMAVTTQGSTKIYRPPPPPASLPLSSPPLSPPTTRQDLIVKIGQGAAFWLAPDPVQPFAGSLYSQTQIFEVEKGGSVGIVDWVSEGRTSRGEKWDCESWRGRNEIWFVGSATKGETVEARKRRLLVRDGVVLAGQDIRGRMEDSGVFGTVLLRGPLFEKLGIFFVDEFGSIPRIGGRNWSRSGDDEAEEQLSETERWRKERLEKEKKESVLWTACHVRGVCVVKFSARAVEGARCWLGDMLKREGTVREEFGDGGVMFVR